MFSLWFAFFLSEQWEVFISFLFLLSEEPSLRPGTI
jgi:hypothetical protein